MSQFGRHRGGEAGEFRVLGAWEQVVPGLPSVFVYRETGAEVQVLRFLHSARLWPRRF
jgi:plasmid stabilization system protein ParE